MDSPIGLDGEAASHRDLSAAHSSLREKRVYDTDVTFRWLRCRNLSAPSGSGRSFRWMPQPGAGIGWSRDGVRSYRIECTSVMSGLGGAPVALLGVDAGRCRRRTGRGSGRCGGTARATIWATGRGGVGPFAWVSADLGCGGREAQRSSMWRASPSTRVARRPPGERRRARRRSGLPAWGKELLVPRLHP
jgi:hypothetical protein